MNFSMQLKSRLCAESNQLRCATMKYHQDMADQSSRCGAMVDKNERVTFIQSDNCYDFVRNFEHHGVSELFLPCTVKHLG